MIKILVKNLQTFKGFIIIFFRFQIFQKNKANMGIYLKISMSNARRDLLTNQTAPPDNLELFSSL